MAYTPTDWVDLVTDVDEAHMDKIEQGLVAAHVTADAAVPKSIVDAQGDLIVASGADAVQRLAKGTNGHVLTAQAGAPGVGWAAPAAPSYGASPPGSPVDGQEWILPVDATDGVMWRFRYRAASASAFKWEFVGGPPLSAAATDQKGRTTATWGDPEVGTPGPSVTIPRAGDYWCSFSANYVHVPTGSALYGVVFPGVGDIIHVLHNSAGDYSGGVGHQGRANNATAGAATMQYQGPGAATLYVNTPSLSVIPVRVS